MVVMIGGLACSLAVLVWWLFFSRAPWAERLGAIALMVVSVIATKRVVHPSIAGGAMGMLLYFFSIPVLSMRSLSPRRWAAVCPLDRGGRRWPPRFFWGAPRLRSSELAA